MLGGASGFYDAYPKRAQKLLVGRSQTLLICYFYMFICGASPLRVCYVFVLFFCSFSLVCMGFRPLISVYPIFSENASIILKILSLFFTLPCYIFLSFFHNVQNLLRSTDTTSTVQNFHHEKESHTTCGSPIKLHHLFPFPPSRLPHSATLFCRMMASYSSCQASSLAFCSATLASRSIFCCSSSNF